MLFPRLEDCGEKLGDEPSTQLSAFDVWGSSNMHSRFDLGVRQTLQGRVKATLQPRCVLLASRVAQGGANPRSASPGAPFAISGASESEPASALQEQGHIQNQMHFHFLEKTIFVVISVY